MGGNRDGCIHGRRGVRCGFFVGDFVGRYIYVNVYETDRVYGGPQEGGWYYDCGNPVKVMPVPRDRAKRLLARVRERLGSINRNDRRRPGSSVLSTGDYLEAWVEDHPGREYPESRPTYE